MTEEKTQKSFVKSGDEATIICPQCNGAKIIAVRQFRQHLHLLKVKCRCGHVFKVQLEFRRHYRKNTDLQGFYFCKPTELEAYFQPLPPTASSDKVKVINLSLSGVCFEFHGTHNVQVGQRGTLVFVLDNRKTTQLNKFVLIRSINGNRIGCEFVEDRAFDKELGFYLRP
jgi:PilZ domain